jgi:hypothetical protein
MIVVFIGGYGAVHREISEGETVDEMLNKLKTDLELHFVGTTTFQETETGRQLPGDEILVDHRRYHLTTALERA